MSPMSRIALVQTIALSAAIALSGAMGLPARAQDRYQDRYQDQDQYQDRDQYQGQDRTVEFGPDYGGLSGPPVMAIVSIKDQRISLYDAKGGSVRSAVSSGSGGYETPVGTYSILQKNREHYSNIYDDAAMPFMQRITWSGIALHQGALPGYPASHGCVRLPETYAERIFPITKIGMRVIVARNDIAPVAIRHAALFKPAPAPQTPVVAEQTSYESTYGYEDSERKTRPFEADLRNWPEREAELAALKAIAAEKVAEAERLKGPVEDIKAELEPHAAQRKAAEKALKSAEKAKKATEDAAIRANKALSDAKDPARLKPLEAAKVKAEAAVIAASERLTKVSTSLLSAKSERERRKLSREVRAAERAKRAAEAQSGRAARELTAAQEPGRFKKQEDAVKKAQSLAAGAAQRHADAAAALQAVLAEHDKVSERLKAAEAALAAAAQTAQDAKRKTYPVSMFISLKTQRLYVRQGHEPIVDVPITIADPDMPIGTHVYTAVDYEEGAKDLHWTAVSLNRLKNVAEVSNRSRRRDIDIEPYPTDLGAATSALDRISIPAEIVQRFQASFWPGSSLIVSDEPMHKETNQATDFIVLMSGEPQGGIKRRPKPQPQNYYASSSYYSYYGNGYNSGYGYKVYGRPVRVQPKKNFFDWW